MSFVFKHPSKYKKMKKENPGMENVKWDQIPPLSGPDPRGLINQTKQYKPNQLEKINGRNRQSINRPKKKG